MFRAIEDQVKNIFHEHKFLFLVAFGVGLGLGIWLGSL